MQKKFLFVLCMTLAVTLGGQQMRGMDFKDQEIKNILLVLGEVNGVSIIPDETVEGRASYYFSVMDFEMALKIFLDAFGLNYTKQNGVYYVSKVKIQVDSTNNKVSVNASEVPIRSILKLLSNQVGKTILFDNIPNEPFTINVSNVELSDVLKIFIAKYPDFVLDIQDSFLYLRRRATEGSAARPGDRSKMVQRSGEFYTLLVEKGRFKELTIELFKQAKREFLFLTDRDVNLENLFLTNLAFDEALRVLLLQGNADFSVLNDVYYIYEVQRRDLMKKFLSNRILNLQYISASDLVKLLPSSLSASSQMKVDEKSNKVILSGSLEEITPLLEFIQMVDKPGAGNKAVRFDLKHLKTDELLPLLPPEFTGFGPQALPGKSAFLIQLPDSKRPDLERFLTMVDRPLDSTPIRLRFLKSEDFFAHLPPSVTESNFVRTKDHSLIFFKGSEDQRRNLMKDLSVIDVPKPQIRYEVFVIQYDKNKGLNLDSKVIAKNSSEDFAYSYVGALGNLMSVGFDIISDFGVQFGLTLSASLSEGNARVLADTTLNALSGEKVSFQNTITNRFTETVTLPGTGGNPVTSTVTRELSSGLILNFEGWISGDKMITMKIDSTLSKVNDTNTKDTSEKKISTHVRTPSGKPVIIGGLKQEDVTVAMEKVPFLGDIPLLGLLFQKTSEKIVQTEFSIYLVPHLENPEDSEYHLEDGLVSLYERLSGVY